jgi:uncharacterized protein YfiM (DUF2279 family)
MARPSKIDRLPSEVRDLIGRLREGGRTIDEILLKLNELDLEVSRSGLHRHVQQWDKIRARLQESRAAAEAIMGQLGHDKDNRLARFNIELMHASLQSLLAGGEDGQAVTLDPESAMLLSSAIRNLASASKTDQDRELRIRKEVAAELAAKAEKAVDKVAARRGWSRDDVAELKAGFLMGNV